MVLWPAARRRFATTAVAELRANAGTQFDPGVVGQLVALVETSPELYGAEEAIAL